MTSPQQVPKSAQRRDPIIYGLGRERFWRDNDTGGGTHRALDRRDSRMDLDERSGGAARYPTVARSCGVRDSVSSPELTSRTDRSLHHQSL